MSIKTKISFSALFLIVFTCLEISASVFPVNSLGDSGPGTLRQAIINSNFNPGSDQIKFFAEGTILLLSDLPTIEGNVDILGNNSTIDGQMMHRAFVTGTGLEIRIFNLTIQHCSGDDGPALLSGSGSTTLNNCTLDNNKASDDGGAIFNRGTLYINYSTLSNNIAGDDGGAIRSIGGVVYWDQSTIAGNRADGSGGGVYIGKNSSNVQGVMYFTNSTISGNTTGQGGGGIRIADGKATLNNVTVAFNQAAQHAGGIALHGSSMLTLGHTIVAKNTIAAGLGPDIRSYGISPISTGYNLLGINNNANFNPGEGDQSGTSGTPLDPLLNPLADYGGQTMTHSLQAGSPAINKGGNCAVTDQRGLSRHDGSCDIGAFEEGALSVPTLSQWGLIILALGLAIFAIVAIRQREIDLAKPRYQV